MNRKAETFNKIVMVNEYNEITVLQDAFQYEDGFKGLTGSTFYPVSKKEYKERTSLNGITEKLRDCVVEEEIPEHYLLTDKGYKSKNPYKLWAKEIINCGEEEEFAFDTSYCNLWDYIREELNLSEKDAYIFECIGGGRCFNKDDKFTHNKELEYLLKEYEG